MSQQLHEGTVQRTEFSELIIESETTLHCKKILFTTAVPRIFPALVMKNLPMYRTSFSRALSAFLLSYRSEKVPALAVVFPHYEQDRSDRKLTFFQTANCRKIPA